MRQNSQAHHRLAGLPGERVCRLLGFWRRSSGIFFGYQLAKLRAGLLPEAERHDHWQKQHQAAGKAIYSICVDYKGLFIKTGQFIGARGEFFPQALCNELARLQDAVPPMAPAAVEALLKAELQASSLDDIFEWIDTKTPLGSASIAQVHKAKLLCTSGGGAPHRAACAEARVGGGGGGGGEGRIVAVKVQYPNAEQEFTQDFATLRLLAGLVSRTELAFDMRSAADEVISQVERELDFCREAEVTDQVHRHLHRSMRGRVVVPRSIPGLVTKRVIVMDYLPGLPISQLASRTAHLPAHVKAAASRKIMNRVGEAYGRMMLETGLFQADGHPGNILVMSNGAVGLLDYGQAQQLTPLQRRTIAATFLSVASGSASEVEKAMTRLGIVTDCPSSDLAAMHGGACFDTATPVGIFSDNSPLRACSITSFPRQYFFVMRAVQLLRGLSVGMGVEYSTVRKWKRFAQSTLSRP